MKLISNPSEIVYRTAFTNPNSSTGEEIMALEKRWEAILGFGNEVIVLQTAHPLGFVFDHMF